MTFWLVADHENTVKKTYPLCLHVRQEPTDELVAKRVVLRPRALIPFINKQKLQSKLLGKEEI
jgi:hypothetical protein